MSYWERLLNFEFTSWTEQFSASHYNDYYSQILPKLHSRGIQKRRILYLRQFTTDNLDKFNFQWHFNKLYLQLKYLQKKKKKIQQIVHNAYLQINKYIHNMSTECVQLFCHLLHFLYIYLLFNIYLVYLHTLIIYKITSVRF